MATRCAACGSRIPSSNFDTFRCADCRAMTCRRCRATNESECPVCGSAKPPKTHEGIWMGILILAVVGLTLAVLLVPDIASELSTASPAATAIADAAPGEHVRLEGKIVSDTEVALDSAYNESHGHHRFLRHPLVLTSRDGASNITLELREETIIYKGTHPSTDGNPNGTSYHANDSVTAIGTVFTNATGAKWLRTEKMAPAGTDLEPPGMARMFLMAVLLVIAGIIPGLIVAMLAYWASILRANSKLVEAQGGFFKVRLPQNHEAAALSPIENRALPFFRSLGLALLAVGLVLAVTAALSLLGLAGPLGSAGLAGISAAVSLIVTLVAVVLLQAYLTAPRSVAVDGRGFTLRFRGGRSEGFFWDEVAAVVRPAELIGLRESSKYEGLFLALANGQVVTVHFASTEMAQAIDKGKLAHPQWSGKANLKQALGFMQALQRMAAGPAAVRVADKIRALKAMEAPPAGK